MSNLSNYSGGPNPGFAAARAIDRGIHFLERRNEVNRRHQEAQQMIQAHNPTPNPSVVHGPHTPTTVATSIPVRVPDKWQGGTVRYNPQAKKMEANPAYKEWQSRKQHFDTAMQQQTATFQPSLTAKIPAAAKRAMQPKPTPKVK